MPDTGLNQLSDLPGTFKALADPTRLRLLNLLSGGEVCVCFLAQVLEISQPKVSRHLAYLKKSGLVASRKRGQWVYYRWARPSHPVSRALMEGLRAWMARNAETAREQRDLHKLTCL